MTIYRNTFQIYKTYGGTNYYLDGTSGENISWRNVFGNLMREVTLDSNVILSAGFYEITVDSTSYDAFVAYAVAHSNNYFAANTHAPIYLNVTNRSQHSLFSPSIQTYQVVLDAYNQTYRSDVGQTHIIPGLTLKFNDWGNIFKTDKVHIIVGGRWITDEDRYLEDTLFGDLSSSGPETSAITLTVVNNSVTTLSNIEAKVVNKISINQDSFYSEDFYFKAYLPVKPYYSVLPNNDNYTVNTYDIITEMTTEDTPSPIRSNCNSSIKKESWKLFQRTEGIPRYFDYSYNNFDNNYRPNFVSDASLGGRVYTSSGYLFVDEFNAITYDFGKGNFKSANCLVLWDKWYLNSFYFYGSAEDVDDPTEWDELFYSGDSVKNRTVYLTYSTYYMNFYYFKSSKQYRHFKLVPYYMQSGYSVFYLGRIELLNVSLPIWPMLDNDTYYDVVDFTKLNTYRPFYSLKRNYSQNPIFGDYEDYPLRISFANASGGEIDILVDGKKYDVYEVSSGDLYERGEGLSYDSATEYVFSDNSPYAGLSFILRSTLTSTSFGADLYMSNGSEVFEIKSDTDNAWSSKGEKCAVTDELDAAETFTLYVRANPTTSIKNSDDYPVEGLLEISGTAESSVTLFTGTMSQAGVKKPKLDSMRVVLGPFNYTGIKVRIKFADSVEQKSNVYWGKQLITSSFVAGTKVNVTFDSGAYFSTNTTDVWTDWFDFDIKPGETYLLSYERADSGSVFDDYKNSSYITNSSYRCVRDTSGIDDYDYSTHSVYDETSDTTSVCDVITTACIGIAEIQIKVTDYHIATIPLSAIVRDKLSSVTINTNIVDDLTASALASFGITAGEIS